MDIVKINSFYTELIADGLVEKTNQYNPNNESDQNISNAICNRFLNLADQPFIVTLR